MTDIKLNNTVNLFLKNRGLFSEGTIFQKLKGDGSKRNFWRIIPSQKKPCLVLMVNPPASEAEERENLSYVMIGKHLRNKGIPLPEIFGYNLEEGWVIMEDMGDMSLEKYASSTEDPVSIYKRVLESLLLLQTEGARNFDTSWCCQTQRYDYNVMRQYEADYFRDAFLCLYLGLKNEWPELEPPFNHLTEKASVADNNYLIHRDFQSRNIMVNESNIGFIDWQGSRLGPLGYDLASLVIDPYTGLSFQQRYRIYKYYLSLISEHCASLTAPFEESFLYLAIQRNLQIIGAFSYLTKKMNKIYFEAYIPAALKTLSWLLSSTQDPQLSPLLDLIDHLK